MSLNATPYAPPDIANKRLHSSHRAASKREGGTTQRRCLYRSKRESESFPKLFSFLHSDIYTDERRVTGEQLNGMSVLTAESSMKDIM